MNPKVLSALLVLPLAAILGGCASETPPLPQIHYPVTYQVPIGNQQAASSYGAQNLTVSATQDVMVQPGMNLYYQILSPVSVNVYIYEKTGSGPGGNLLTQTQGMTINSSVNPPGSTLEFVFQASQANTSGTIQFTLSDQPITPPPPQANGPVPPPVSR